MPRSLTHSEAAELVDIHPDHRGTARGAVLDSLQPGLQDAQRLQHQVSAFLLPELPQADRVRLDAAPPRLKDRHAERNVAVVQVERDRVRHLSGLVLQLPGSRIDVREFERAFEGAIVRARSIMAATRHLGRNRPGKRDAQRHVAHNGVMPGDRQRFINVQVEEHRRPEALPYRRRWRCSGIHANDMTIHGVAGVPCPREEEDGFEQRSLPYVVPACNEVDATPAINLQVAKTAELAYVESFQHGSQPCDRIGSGPERRQASAGGSSLRFTMPCRALSKRPRRRRGCGEPLVRTRYSPRNRTAAPLAATTRPAATSA